MTNKATLTYEIIEFGETHTIVFDINKESLMGYMTIYDDVGNMESRTEYFLSDKELEIQLLIILSENVGIVKSYIRK